MDGNSPGCGEVVDGLRTACGRLVDGFKLPLTYVRIFVDGLRAVEEFWMGRGRVAHRLWTSCGRVANGLLTAC